MVYYRAWLLSGLLGWAGMVAGLELSPEEAAGKRLYLEGTGAGGAEIFVRIGPADTPMPSSVGSCAGCHGSDGRGGREGGLRPPDITWRHLTTPHEQGRDRRRPGYNAATFARALTEGLDPAGRRLNPAMPRFVMSQRDMANLTAYIKQLEEDLDPGLYADVVRLGTLLPASGPLMEAGQTIAALLRGAIDGINASGGIHGRRLELVIADPGADQATAEVALRDLLELQDVFALVAPLAPALDGRFGELLDAQQVPLVGPLLQLEGESGSALIFNPLPGMREQMFALGDFAADSLNLRDPQVLIAHPLEMRQQEIAGALAARLRARGWSRVGLFPYGPGGQASVDTRASGLQAVFFLGPSTALVGLGTALHDSGAVPYLFATAEQAGSAALRLPKEFTERLFLAYPFLVDDWTPVGSEALLAARRHSGLNERHGALQVSAYSALSVLAEGLKRSGRDASRAKLLAALESLHAFRTGLTPKLGFGPGRRVGAPGAHIVTVNIAERRFRPTGQYVELAPDR